MSINGRPFWQVAVPSRVGNGVRERVCMVTDESSVCKQNVATVVRKATECLPDMLQESGRILYSSCETLKPGDYYFLGVNPGGSPGETKETIQSTLEGLSALTKASRENAYINQCWCGKGGCTGCCLPLQKRFRFLFEDVLEVNPLDVCATNLIFQRSRRQRDVAGWELAKTCWSVHDVILKIVQPRVIITHGSLPFDFISDRLRGKPAQEPQKCKHANWTWRCSRLETGQKLIGLPHLSIYAIDSPSRADIVKEIVKQIQSD